MKLSKIARMLGVVVASAALLAACRAEEQGRVLLYKPGTYLGKKDTQLSEEQIQKLRARTAYQGSQSDVTGGGESQAGSDVRPPPPRPQ